MTRKKLKDVVDKVWPKTKKELEKAIKNAKKYLAKGEEYFTEISEKGVKQTKRLCLGLKKEKLCHDLGKAVAVTAAAKWKTNKKITALIKEIKKLDSQIKQIK